MPRNKTMLIGALLMVPVVFLSACASRRLEAFAYPLLDEPQTPRRDVVTASWERVDNLGPESTDIVVVLKNGEKTKCTFRKSTTESIVVTDATADERTIPKSEIRRILGPRGDEDRLLNGALIGLATGFGAGAILGYGISVNADVATRITIPVIGGLGAGIGTLIGYLVDKRHRTREILYEVP